MFELLYIQAMRRGIFHLSIVLMMTLAGCATVPAGDTSRNALDWPGTYAAEGMSVTLRENLSYRARIGSVEVRSTFRWDSKGRTILLQNLNAAAPCKKFKVGENVLIPLKNSGKPHKDAEHLLKISESDQ